MHKLILNIGGFSILLQFEKTTQTQRKNTLIDLLSQRYFEFVSKDKPRNFDYIISFIFMKEFRSLTSPSGNHIFINLYDQTNEFSLTTFYHISLFQFDMILTHVLQDLLKDANGFIIHTSVASLKGKAWFFMGISGAGKSTVVDLLSKKYIPLSDDVGIIRKIADIYYFYHMPLLNKNKAIQVSSRSFPVGGVCFLHQSQEYRMSKIKNKKMIIEKLFGQLYSEKEDIRKQLVDMTIFVNTFSNFYDMFFGKNAQKVLKLFDTI